MLIAKVIETLVTFDLEFSIDQFHEHCRNISSAFIFINFILCDPQVPNLVFLAVSPEEKELWVNAINAAIIRAKNRVLDEVGDPCTVLVLSQV